MPKTNKFPRKYLFKKICLAGCGGPWDLSSRPAWSKNAEQPRAHRDPFQKNNKEIMESKETPYSCQSNALKQISTPISITYLLVTPPDSTNPEAAQVSLEKCSPEKQLAANPLHSYQEEGRRQLYSLQIIRAERQLHHTLKSIIRPGKKRHKQVFLTLSRKGNHLN